ncbi:MAG: RNA-binding S4 domain-containing protein [Candidatus Omnitrophica bacterium]|nr:RNA-binding S4 domain-containing protein [Candidatus Omnitrophota bacterium]
MEFKLTSVYIELDNLLKISGVVSSGPEAKIFIQGGNVSVNGEPEMRVRRKLKAGDIITFESKEISLVKGLNI